jgi:hypothetical protein
LFMVSRLDFFSLKEELLSNTGNTWSDTRRAKPSHR